ncbi:MAG: hypothetical protein ACOYK8_06215 [Alphaproteobacteria bacterium]
MDAAALINAVEGLVNQEISPIDFADNLYLQPDVFVAALQERPAYAATVLAQCLMMEQPPAAIETIKDYIIDYYSHTASVPQLTRFIVAATEISIDESNMFSANIKQDIGDLANELLFLPIDDDSLANRQQAAALQTQLLLNAKEAALVISNAKIPELYDIGRMYHLLNGDFNDDVEREEEAALLANPSQWLYDTEIKTGRIAAFLLVMDDLGATNKLSPQILNAYLQVRQFITEILPEWYDDTPEYRRRTLQEEIAQQQQTLLLVSSATFFEELNSSDLEGLQQEVALTAHRGYTDKNTLINYEVAIADIEGGEDWQHRLRIENWLKRQWRQGEKYEHGFAIVEIEERLQQPNLSSKVVTALKNMQQIAQEYFTAKPLQPRGKITEPERTLKYCRIYKRIDSLEGEVPGFNGIKDCLSNLEKACQNTRLEEQGNFEESHLADPKNSGRKLEIGRYLALAEDVLTSGTKPQKETAEFLLDYLNYYVSAAGHEIEHDILGCKQHFIEIYIHTHILEKQGLDLAAKKFLDGLSQPAIASRFAAELDLFNVTSEADAIELSMTARIKNYIIASYFTSGREELFLKNRGTALPWQQSTPEEDEKRQALEAMAQFDPHQHIMEYLYATPVHRLATPLSGACALLAVEQAIAFDPSRKELAEQLLPLLCKAIENADMGEQTTIIKEEITNWLGLAEQHLDFLPHEEIKDYQKLLEAFKYPATMANYQAIALAGIDAIESGAVIVTSGQQQALRDFSQQIETFMNGDMFDAAFKEDFYREYPKQRVNIAISTLIEAQLPELSAIQHLLSNKEAIGKFCMVDDLMIYNLFTPDAEFDHLAERFFAGVSVAKERIEQSIQPLSAMMGIIIPAMNEALGYLEKQFNKLDQESNQQNRIGHRNEMGYMQRVAYIKNTEYGNNRNNHGKNMGNTKPEANF